ncbi:MAG: T9SS type A sorting domain-containing protein, partial [Chitinophagaceae bacterium]|nr:T9SS type A sorting domain-containing protein [Chitinophagaceae bacterium]
PNPTNGTFTVQLPQGGTAVATITDVAGRTLSTHTITHNLPVSTTLPPGIYLIHLTTATVTWRSKLIIE